MSSVRSIPILKHGCLCDHSSCYGYGGTKKSRYWQTAQRRHRDNLPDVLLRVLLQIVLGRNSLDMERRDLFDE